VDPYQSIVDRTAESGGVIVLVGGIDSGKTTLGRAIARAGARAGRSVAFLDADLGQKTVGPPACVGLRMVRGEDDLESGVGTQPDELSFVGSTSPQGQLLPLVVGTGLLQARARELGADLVVVDTSGLVSGVYGQILKFHKIELLRPDVVVGLARGEELDPLLGIVRRFFPTDVVTLQVHPDVRSTSVEERAQRREEAMRDYFGESQQRWRVKPTVFMPALPALFDHAQLDRLLVGMSDGAGRTSGIGFLEHSAEDGVLRLISPVADAPTALKLGSVRLDPDFRVRRVDLRNLFGTD
jgi:polynucleotide 5'-hydroxyl-kinase GRC3/NOL9